MKIALIAKLFAPISPFSTGGTETFVYNLALELDKRGHQITVLTTGDSEIIGNVKIVPVVEESFWKKYSEDPKKFEEFLECRRAMSKEDVGYLKILFYLAKNKKNFDIVHDNSLNFLPLILHQQIFDLPFIATLHMPPKLLNIEEILKDGNIPRPDNYYIAISENQKMSADFDIFAVNYNGIDKKRFVFSDKNENFLAWVGRISPEKGLETAIRIAVQLNLPLKIVGPKVDREYLKEKVEPLLENTTNVSIMGEKIGNKLVEIYQNAKIVLFPISWDEPFGLVMIEAMACGTPVVAFRRGSVPEIIKDGETGFICPSGDIDCMVRKVKEIYEMPEEKYRAMRQACRKHVEKNFTVEKMVDGYERVYEKVIEDFKKRNKLKENRN